MGSGSEPGHRTPAADPEPRLERVHRPLPLVAKTTPGVGQALTAPQVENTPVSVRLERRGMVGRRRAVAVVRSGDEVMARANLGRLGIKKSEITKLKQRFLAMGEQEIATLVGEIPEAINHLEHSLTSFADAVRSHLHSTPTQTQTPTKAPLKTP